MCFGGVGNQTLVTSTLLLVTLFFPLSLSRRKLCRDLSFLVFKFHPISLQFPSGHTYKYALSTCVCVCVCSHFCKEPVIPKTIGVRNNLYQLWPSMI